jgi:hypothetical protein
MDLFDDITYQKIPGKYTTRLEYIQYPGIELKQMTIPWFGERECS